MRTQSKYRAKPTVVDGIRFASIKESRRYVELMMLARTGAITHLVLQPRFELWAAKPMSEGHRGIEKVGAYVGDFQYRDQDNGGITVVEDVKGMKTPLYRLKKKLAEACHGISITEI